MRFLCRGASESSYAIANLTGQWPCADYSAVRAAGPEISMGAPARIAISIKMFIKLFTDPPASRPCQGTDPGTVADIQKSPR